MLKYNYIDLFHGIGGFALGAFWAGMKFENHFCSDIEKYTQKLYKLRFPCSIQLGDITKIDTEDLKKYSKNWILSGGFPCQDISIAGKGKGLKNEDGTFTRSGLWFDYWRIIRDLRPRFAIMENVSALTIRGGLEVIGSLAEIGYNAEWQDIRAEDMGAPHKRERIWIVAYPSSNRQSGQGQKSTFQNRQEERSEQTRKLPDRSKRCCFEISNTICKHDDNTGHGAGEICRERPETSEISGRISDTMRPGLPTERTEQQTTGIAGEGSRAREWPTEPSVGRLAHGLPGRVDRLKGLGNAIVPQIAQILFEQIKPLL